MDCGGGRGLAGRGGGGRGEYGRDEYEEGGGRGDDETGGERRGTMERGEAPWVGRVRGDGNRRGDVTGGGGGGTVVMGGFLDVVEENLGDCSERIEEELRTMHSGGGGLTQGGRGRGYDEGARRGRGQEWGQVGGTQGRGTMEGMGPVMGSLERINGKRGRLDYGEGRVENESEGTKDTEISWMAASTRLGICLDGMYAQFGVGAERVCSQTLVMKALMKMMLLHGETMEKVVALQEENKKLQVEVYELRMVGSVGAGGKLGEGVGAGRKTYAEAVVGRGRTGGLGGAGGAGRMTPVIPHESSEKVVIVRPRERSNRVSREEQETFRQEVRSSIREDIAKDIVAIRTTRGGGYAVVSRSEKVRDEVAKGLKEKVIFDGSEVITPKKKWSRFICRNAPHEGQIKEVLADSFGRNNERLNRIDGKDRVMNINSTKIGWIVETSGEVARAIEMQGYRIRYGWCKELQLDEFVPLQQCFKCCQFGHIAMVCTSRLEWCRMCGKSGHGGRECPDRDNRDRWQCCNCTKINRSKGMKLDTDHTAAQLHRCRVAENERAVRRQQMQRDGVTVAMGKEIGDFLGLYDEGGREKVNVDVGSRKGEDSRKGSTVSMEEREAGWQVQTRGRRGRGGGTGMMSSSQLTSGGRGGVGSGMPGSSKDVSRTGGVLGGSSASLVRMRVREMDEERLGTYDSSKPKSSQDDEEEGGEVGEEEEGGEIRSRVTSYSEVEGEAMEETQDEGDDGEREVGGTQGKIRILRGGKERSQTGSSTKLGTKVISVKKGTSIKGVYYKGK